MVIDLEKTLGVGLVPLKPKWPDAYADTALFIFLYILHSFTDSASLFTQDVRNYNQISFIFGIINYMQQSAEHPTYSLYLFVLYLQVKSKTYTAGAGAILHVTYGRCREVDGKSAEKRNNDIWVQATRKLHQAFIFNGNHTATRRSNVANTTMSIAKSVHSVHQIQ